MATGDAANPQRVGRSDRPGPAGRRAERVTVWALRAGWLAAPFTVGAALAEALDRVDPPVRTTASLLAWLAWAGALAALALPRTTSLTAARTIVPAALPVAGWAAARTSLDPTAVIGLTVAAATAAAVLSGPFADAFVDGSSYGAERRLALKVPPALFLGPVPLAWSVVVSGPTVGPLLLADERWVLGAVASVVLGGGAVLAARSLHQLSRRWLVFVPAGVVVHDLLGMREPVLFQRHGIVALGPAPRDEAQASFDVTGGASGLVLRLELIAPVDLPRPGRGEIETVSAHSLLVSPCRPGVTLAEASHRRLPIG